MWRENGENIISVMPEHIIGCMDVMSKRILISLRVTTHRLVARHAQQKPRYGISVQGRTLGTVIGAAVIKAAIRVAHRPQSQSMLRLAALEQTAPSGATRQ